MAATGGASRRRRRRRRNPIFKLFAYLLLIIAMLFGISVFFKITHIEVKGNTKYQSGTIKEIADIKDGGNLFFIKKSEIESGITKELPYVEKVTISRKLPGTVVIGVSESYPAANILYAGNYYIIDRNCKVLEKTNEAGAAGTITVLGMATEAPLVGETLVPNKEDTVKFTYLCSLLTRLLERNMQSGVSQINLSNITNVSFEYMGRFTVELGKYEKSDSLDKKLEFMDTLIRLELSDNDTGIIDITADNMEIHFYQR